MTQIYASTKRGASPCISHSNSDTPLGSNSFGLSMECSSGEGSSHDVGGDWSWCWEVSILFGVIKCGAQDKNAFFSLQNYTIEVVAFRSEVKFLYIYCSWLQFIDKLAFTELLFLKFSKVRYSVFLNHYYFHFLRSL